MPESVATNEERWAQLRTIDDWRRNSQRPVVLVGNGPSAASVDPRRLPHDAIVVRMNAFFFEESYTFGPRADAVFWAVARRWLQVGYAVAQRRADYQMGTFFSPTAVRTETLYSLRDEAASLANELTPRFSHFDLLRAHPMLKHWFAPRKDRVRPGLPTQGMQALATMLSLGYSDFHIAGMDFYQTAGARYAFPYPTFIREMTASVHQTAGYEGKHHSINLDLEFFYFLRRLFPAARIRSLSPKSFLTSLVGMSPLEDVGSVSQPVKDVQGFHADLEQSLRRPFRRPTPLVGEVSRVSEDKLIGWAWSLDQPAARQSVELRVAGRVVETFTAEQHLHELELGCIGDARHGFTRSLSDLRRRFGDGDLEFRRVPDGSPLLNGRLSTFCAIRTARADLSEVSLIGGADLEDDELAVLATRVHTDSIVDLRSDGVGSGLNDPTDEIVLEWFSRAYPHGDSSSPATGGILLEIATVLWAAAHLRDRGVRLLGLRSFLEPGWLLGLVRSSRAAGQDLLNALRTGRMAVHSRNALHVLKAIEMITASVIVVTDEQGALPSSQNSLLSLSFALSDALPHAVRLPIGLWDAGVAHALDHVSGDGVLLVDEAALANASQSEFAAILKKLKEVGTSFCLLSSLPIAEAEPKQQRLRQRITQLREAGSRFLTRSADVRRALIQLYGLDPSTLVALAGPARWRSQAVDPRRGRRCALLVDDVSPVRLRAIRRAIWRLPPEDRESIELDVIPVDLIGQREHGSRQADRVRFGVGVGSSDEIAAYDLLGLATEDIGLSVGARMAALAQCPVIAIEGCGLSELLPPDAVLPDVDAVLARMAESAQRAIRAASPPASGEAMARTAVADLIAAMFGAEAASESVDLVLHAGRLPQPSTISTKRELGLSRDLKLALMLDPSTHGELVMRLLVLNDGGEWIPARVAGRCLDSTVQVYQADTGSLVATLRKPLPRDLPPGQFETMLFHVVVEGAAQVVASLALGGERPLVATDFGRIGEDAASND